MKEASIVASALYLDRPFFGSRRMAVTLGVGRTRIRRLMRILGNPRLAKGLDPTGQSNKTQMNQFIFPVLFRSAPGR
jgi:hypothetical protein